MTKYTTLSEELNQLPRERQEAIQARASEIYKEDKREVLIDEILHENNMIQVVFDTNILISALLSINTDQRFKSISGEVILSL